MEHNAIQWLGAPSCQRGSYSFYKSVSSRSRPDGPVQVWRLGEFYSIRCGPQDPVCIAEVTLLWEDQTRRHLLASTRLYFLPEDTPKGRTSEHGEDEVLAVSRKMVMRVEDLVRWSCSQPVAWTSGVKMLSCSTNGLHKAPQGGASHSSIKSVSEPLKDKTENDQEEHQGVKVLSYPQYCRYRSLQRRIQDGARGPGLQDPHLLALGGIKVRPHTRLMYCRDTFNHPTLETSTGFSWQFRCPSLSLRGRPRKRRGHDGKDSPTSSPSESWIEKMKENVMGSVEVGCEGAWLPHPEEQLFLDQLFAFMDRQGSPIHKVPNLGFKKIDLFLMYSVVKRLGGYKKVTLDRLWKVVYNELGGCPGSTSAATCTRRHYERLMLPYEEHLRAGGAEFKVPDAPMAPRPRGIRGRKPLPRGRRPGPKAKDKKIPAARTVVTSGVVVKRGRGRPPGTRNKATLVAQAKLLAQQQTKTESLQSPAPSGSAPGSTHRPVLNMPLTPDLSPLPSPFLPFQTKDLKPDRAESAAPAVLLSTLPRHFVGGSLGGFSPIKGVCPLDVFRSRVSLQRGAETPALTPQDPVQHPAQHQPAVFTLQPKTCSPDSAPPAGDQQHNRCSGCSADEQQAGVRDSRSRPPLPPLRVLPLNLDCSVQVCQLMRTRLGSSQFQTFTRRLSEALSQDLKPPCSPITPPPEQPLNLSKRFPTKRPGSDEAGPAAANGDSDPPPAKRPGSGSELGDEPSPSSGEGGGGGEQEADQKNQDEPADLSSPSRIRAFLLGLPPFQVKFEEDLNGSRFGKFLPPGSKAEPQRPETESRGASGGVGGAEVKQEQQEDKDDSQVSGPGPGPGPGPAPTNTDSQCV